MKYSKILLGAFIFFGLGVFSSCDVNDEFYDELDAAKTGTENAQALERTLSAEDYSAISKLALKSAKIEADSTKAKAIASLLSFSDDRPAANYIPAFLNDTYKNFDKTSSANVTFSYDTRDAEYLLKYTDSEYFKLGKDEYASVDATTGEAGFFTPNFPAEDYLNDILKAKYTEAVDGDVVLVSYDSRETNYDPSEVDVVTVFEADFSDNIDQFETRSVVGDQEWYQSSYSGAGYAKMSGYSSGARHDNEDWLITAEIDLTETPDAILNFSQAQNFLSGDWQQTFIYVREGYTAGDALDVADWTEIVLADENKPAGDSYSYVESGDISLSAYNGKKIHIAFVYKSAAPDDASTWQISQLSVKGYGRPEGETFKVFYAFDGSDWEMPENVYNLQRGDYTEMGSGPGKYGNFSSSVAPEDYLPIFLMNKYPYAQEGDMMVMVYKYYSGGTKTIASEYTYKEGAWSTMPEKSEQYIYAAGELGWVFDPTVSFKMSKEDYHSIVVYSIAEHGETSKYSTSEYYYGSSSNYDNFDLRIKNRRDPVYKIDGYDGLSDEETIALMDERMSEGVEIMLGKKYPEATTQVNGIDVFYNVTVITFEEGDGGYVDGEYTLKFQCTKSGPSPEFTYIEGLPER
ncbi:choice-of-anchor J domain-containing protein [Ancylomarina sp. DW003]|nr:choice-of-anchor J domain-containing protein [Ancylomarina sp. DW003]MDE5423448.1 choice-of-anchor J domain-containing protein [Ancylomarina sp. DW003]